MTGPDRDLASMYRAEVAAFFQVLFPNLGCFHLVKNMFSPVGFKGNRVHYRKYTYLLLLFSGDSSKWRLDSWGMCWLSLPDLCGFADQAENETRVAAARKQEEKLCSSDAGVNVNESPFR